MNNAKTVRVKSHPQGHHASRTVRLVFAPLLLAVCIAQAYAEEVTVYGEGGARGADATAAGGAGGNGQPGKPASGVTQTLGDAVNDVTVSGGWGGQGGAGGVGTASIKGGSGGQGGDGGQASAKALSTYRGTARSLARAFVEGGRGGDAGQPGISGGAGAGAGAHGGNGGHARGEAERQSSDGDSAISYAEAAGGQGGTAQGAGFRGGKGGSVTVRASSKADKGDGYAMVDGRGGAGGAGQSGANGGDGAAVQLASTVSAASSGKLTLRQFARGGEGGRTDSGQSGKGGRASSSLTLDDRAASNVEVRLEASGGSGGEAVSGTTSSGSVAEAKGTLQVTGALTASAFVRGGWGGRSRSAQGGHGADAKAQLHGSSAKDARVQVDVIGGGGGEGGLNGYDESGQGGHGGGATGQAYGVSTGGGAVTVGLNVQGGQGGSGIQGGGRGGDARSSNTLGGSTRGSLTLNGSATGGEGGHSVKGLGGAGGNARFDMTLDNKDAASLNALFKAIGGHGGYSGAIQGAAGGAASSTGKLSGLGHINLMVEATGGDSGRTSGHSLAGGAARAEAHAIGRGTGRVDISAYATGGKGGLSQGGAGAAAGDGGSAQVRAWGESASADVAVRAKAVGGDGGEATDHAPGGNGSTVSLFNRVGGRTAGKLSLAQGAEGGSGGGGRSGRGTGGLAESVLQIDDRKASFLSVNVSARGGRGGATFGYDDNGMPLEPGIGDRGGRATARADVRGVGALSVRAEAYAGQSGGGAAGADSDASARAVTIGHHAVDMFVFSGAGGGGASGEGVQGVTGGQAKLSAWGASDSGAVNVEGHATAGNGGFGYGGFNGADGRSVSLVNAVNGRTTGDLRLVQRAWGGNGGDLYYPGSVNGSKGGAGGAATSSLTLENSVARRIVAGAYARGGTGYNATQPASGHGRADADIAITSHLKGAIVSANAGAGASNGIASPMTAKADALTTGAGAASYAFAETLGGAMTQPGLATARAEGYNAAMVGASARLRGEASHGDAQAISRHDVIGSIRTQATADLAGWRASSMLQTRSSHQTAQGTAFATIPALYDALTYSFANGVVADATRAAILADNAALGDVLGADGHILASGAMGTSRTGMFLTAEPDGLYKASAEFNIALAGRGDLFLGLMDASGFGTDFGSLSFSVSSGNTVLVNEQFDSFAQAQAFFTRQALSLGSFAGGMANISVDLSLKTKFSQGLGINYVLGSTIGAVPEVDQWLLALAGLGVMAGMLRRRQQVSRASGASGYRA
jgi:hypothetical protein